jgi:hypothetical protein
VTTTHVAATHRLTRLLATKHTVLVEKFDINTPTEGTCSVDVKELGIQDVPDQANSAAKQFLRYFLLGASSAASQVPTYELSFHPCVSSLGRSLCDTKIIWNRSPPHLSILSPSVSVEHRLQSPKSPHLESRHSPKPFQPTSISSRCSRTREAGSLATLPASSFTPVPVTTA